MSSKTIVVGMSGGVDSSVSALLLKQQGYHVIGIYMKNWEEKDVNGTCTSTEDFEDVVRVCDHLNIPYYSVNFAKEYREHVFEQTVENFKRGLTPNPDVLCNREIKFNFLLEKALSLGADYLATGHYCQLQNHSLLKGLDNEKDQSYFLHYVSKEALNKTIFPVGGMNKTEVRRIAKEYELPTAEKKDSTGICFIGERNFKQFLNQYISFSPGKFEDIHGNIIGNHDGVPFYTIGQRKGLGIGGAGEPWFVAKKDISRNVVTLVQGANHPALFRSEVTAVDLHWINEQPSLPYRCKAKVRYRQADQDCIITKIESGIACVTFDCPQRAVTPQQSIVFYDGNICLGGGIIRD